MQNSSKFVYDGIRGIASPPFEVNESKIIYDGEWINGTPHGRGSVYKSDGAFFKGEFREGEANCVDGLYVYADGSYFRGNIKNSQASGIGTLVYKDKVLIYTGNWVDDKPNGQGK